MTQETAHMPLDERGLEAAREQPGTNHDGIIRAYIQTAAADVSGLERSIDRWRKMVPVAVTAGSPAQIEYALADAKHDIIALWSTIQTLSASNAALEAENERLRVALKQTEYLMTKDSFSAAERLSEGLARVRQARAALSAPKGGQGHG